MSANQSNTTTSDNTSSNGNHDELTYSSLYLLRHGEIATPGILAGKTDVELSEQGWQNLAQRCEALSQTNQINQMISSPLKRCRLFAEHLAAEKKWPLTIESNLQEMNFGDWDGQTYKTLWQLSAEIGNDKCTSKSSPTIGGFWQNPWQCQPPNGEHITEFTSRVDSWWQGWLTEKVRGNTLLICHGGVIKHLLARILQMPLPSTVHMSAIEIPYAGLVKISVCHDNNGKHWPKIVF